MNHEKQALSSNMSRHFPSNIGVILTFNHHFHCLILIIKWTMKISYRFSNILYIYIRTLNKVEKRNKINKPIYIYYNTHKHLFYSDYNHIGQ